MTSPPPIGGPPPLSGEANFCHPVPSDTARRVPTKNNAKTVSQKPLYRLSAVFLLFHTQINFQKYADLNYAKL